MSHPTTPATERRDADFCGLSVAALESRRSDDLRKMILKFGGKPFVSPSMREVPIEPNRAAADFAYQVMTGQIGVVILMTGVGFRFLMRSIEKQVDTQRFLDCLQDSVTIVRGPKPFAALKEYGVTASHRVPAPNTWRELLQLIDSDRLVMNQTVGLQEYGITNASLVAGLEARGATVIPLRVYGWEFPLDIEPMRDNIRAICDGRRDVLMFTSAHQAVNLLRMAESMQVIETLREQLAKMVVVSIGPTTTQMLQEVDIRVDLEPEHPKMGHMVRHAAEHSPTLGRNITPIERLPNPAMHLLPQSLPMKREPPCTPVLRTKNHAPQ